MHSPTGGTHFRGISRNLKFGLPRSRRTYRLDDQPPVGPVLRSRRRESRGPLGKSLRHASVLRGRALLFFTGLGLVALSAFFLLAFEEALSPAPAPGGILLLALSFVSRRRPAFAMRVGAAVVGGMIPVVLFLLFFAGPDVGPALIIQAVVPGIAFVTLVLVLSTLLAASRAADQLAAESDPVT